MEWQNVSTIILLFEDIIWNVISNWLLGTAKIKQTPHDSCSTQYKNFSTIYIQFPLQNGNNNLCLHLFFSVFIQNSKSNRVLAFIFVKLNLGVTQFVSERFFRACSMSVSKCVFATTPNN